MKKLTKLFTSVFPALILTVSAATCGLTAFAEESGTGKAARTILMYISGQGAEDYAFSYCSDF